VGTGTVAGVDDAAEAQLDLAVAVVLAAVVDLAVAVVLAVTVGLAAVGAG
jgi:hypothetical protein